MEKKYTLWQRILSDTPAFFKRAQFLGASLAGMATSLNAIAAIPSKLCTILIAVGSTIAILSQFAVNQFEPNNSSIHEKTK